MKHLIIIAALALASTLTRAQSGLTATAFPIAAKLNANRTVYKDFTLYRYSADGIAYKLYYNNHGEWLHSILSYEEGNLPAGITARVKSAYSGYSISWVDELRSPGQSAVYRVQLKKDKKLVIVQVNDEEMTAEAYYGQ